MGFTRRDLFARVGDGLYGAALAYLAGIDGSAQAAVNGIFDTKPRPPHFPGKAKAVIQFFMHGGPSQVDLFDHKPTLAKFAGQPPGRDLLNDVLFVGNMGGMMPSPFKFAPYGKSGLEFSEVIPSLAAHADDIAVIRSMFSTNFTHGPAIFLMQGGRIFPDRPTLGSWVVYGLGSENQNLPAFVVLDDLKGLPTVGIRNWQSGWLPPVFQGTRLRSEGSPMLNLKPPEEIPSSVMEYERSLLGKMAAEHKTLHPGNPDLDARIASYEMAARMQLSATDALDLSKESDATRTMYGINEEMTASYGRRCLMARRLVERGVRMVQLYMEGQVWDNHSNLESGLRQCCGRTDKPIGALITDLKQRGLYDSTLLVWGGEFGRMPLSQVEPGKEKYAGRDHGPAGFSVWLGGGGIKGGTAYGATDDLGYKAVENRVSVQDFHATVLHLLGLDFARLVYNHNGLKEKLTGQEPARVVKEIIA